jgi:DNA-binding transcriptional MocR family regulator
LRRYAFDEGIAFSTAARVYAELTRRGLVSGEVGRGTFVRASAPRPHLAEPDRKAVVDLEFNSTTVADSDLGVLADALTQVARSSALATASGAAAAKSRWLRTDLLAAHLSRPGWRVEPEYLLSAAGGRQAIAATLSALAEPGKPVGLEALTYPMAKTLAQRLGLMTLPLTMDGEGVVPEALIRANKEAGVRVIYLQPTLHNPLGVTMGETRRQEIAEILERNGMFAVEDQVYGFLASNAPLPLAALAPENVVLIDSFSKRGFSGLSAGLLYAVPAALRSRLVASLREGAWLASPFILSVLSALLEAGTFPGLEQRKRAEAATRQDLLRAGLDGFDIQADPRTYHAWLRLPSPWRSEPFCAASLHAGVAVTPGTNFAVQPGHAPDAVRLAFSAIDLEEFRTALETLRAILTRRPSQTIG